MAVPGYVAVARSVFRAVELDIIDGQLQVCLDFDAIRNRGPARVALRG